ncbi:MAG: ubiquitin-like small modifier protein 1 [Candidatus Natronoplasma sp.]
MSVKIKLFANLAQKAGESEIQVSAENVKEALEGLIGKNPRLDDIIFKDPNKKELSDSITVIKDGRNITYLNGLETELKEGDKLSVFPPVGGG